MNDKRLETLGAILRVMQSLAIIYALAVGVLWYVKGRIWFKETILPLHGRVFFFLLALAAFTLIFSMVIKAVRPYSCHILYQLAYFFGGIAWFYAANYCLNSLGKFWFIFGSCIIGIGLVPIAVIGSIVRENWTFLGFFSLQLPAAGGCWFLAARAASKFEPNRTG